MQERLFKYCMPQIALNLDIVPHPPSRAIHPSIHLWWSFVSDTLMYRLEHSRYTISGPDSKKFEGSFTWTYFMSCNIDNHHLSWLCYIPIIGPHYHLVAFPATHRFTMSLPPPIDTIFLPCLTVDIRTPSPAAAKLQQSTRALCDLEESEGHRYWESGRKSSACVRPPGATESWA